jgi:hypothetical protein
LFECIWYPNVRFTKEIRKQKRKKKKRKENKKRPRGTLSAQCRNQPEAQEALYRIGTHPFAPTH